MSKLTHHIRYNPHHVMACDHNQRDCERRDWWQHLRDDEYSRVYYIDWFGWV